MAKYKSIDLFAGIGGIRMGFDRAFGKDIETVFVSEWDEYAQKTYKLNFKDDFEDSICGVYSKRCIGPLFKSIFFKNTTKKYIQERCNTNLIDTEKIANISKVFSD